MAEHKNKEPQLGDTAPLEMYYMKLNQDQVEARLGKMRRGQVVVVDRDQATRMAMTGIADQVSSSDFDDMRERRAEKLSRRQDAFRSLNEGAGMWDVATYRDVLTAPEDGLRAAWERGIPLVNIHQLRDEDGDPLSPDADIEEIIEARQWLHSDLVAPLAAHDRSSVMGGGSPYGRNVASGPMPLNPGHRAMAEAVQRHDSMAQAIPQSLQTESTRREPPQPSPNRGSRQAQNRARTLQGNQEAPSGGPGPAPLPPAQVGPAGPPISPKAAEAAREAGVPPPQQGKLPQSNKD
jgi:hypothetical protein